MQKSKTATIITIIAILLYGLLGSFILIKKINIIFISLIISRRCEIVDKPVSGLYIRLNKCGQPGGNDHHKKWKNCRISDII